MNLKNDYKTLYEVIEDSNRVFKASKTGFFEDAETVATYAIGAFKAVFEDADHMLYGVDAEGAKIYLDAINALFVEGDATTDTEDVVEPELPAEEEKTEEPEVVTPEEEATEEE